MAGRLSAHVCTAFKEKWTSVLLAVRETCGRMLVAPTFPYRQTAGASVSLVKATEKADEIPTGEEMASAVADLGEQKEGERLGWGGIVRGGGRARQKATD